MNPVTSVSGTAPAAGDFMNPVYFGTRFRIEAPWDDCPPQFAIITAYATTGEKWTDAENQQADQSLEQELRQFRSWLKRITGYSPDSGHAEPGWAVPLDFETACDIGQRYRQDAIYYVDADNLTVSYCDQRRSKVPIGSFRMRLTPGSPQLA